MNAFIAATVKRSMVTARISKIDRTIGRQMRAVVIDNKQRPRIGDDRYVNARLGIAVP